MKYSRTIIALWRRVIVFIILKISKRWGVRRERDAKGKVLEWIKGDGRTDRERYRRGRAGMWWDGRRGRGGQGEWKELGKKVLWM